MKNPIIISNHKINLPKSFFPWYFIPKVSRVIGIDINTNVPSLKNTLFTTFDPSLFPFLYFVVTLTSPNLNGVKKCHLWFSWNMFGANVGKLTVQYNDKDPRRGPNSAWSDAGSESLDLLFF